MQILERWNVCLFVVGTYLAVSARCQADLPACEVSKACRPPTVIISCRNEPLFLYRRPGSSCAICDSGLAPSAYFPVSFALVTLFVVLCRDARYLC